MKLGILATGITPDELLGEYGSYADMFVQLFETAGYQFDYVVYDVREDRFPAAADECDAWLITGSKFGVYEDLPWMRRLKTLIRAIDGLQRPLVGICFGHQIIAATLGGRVEKYRDGWGVGLHHYRLTQQHPELGIEGFTLNAMHQDQVVEKPPRAVTVASSPFCPYAALSYDDRILSLQAHPEFSLPFEARLVAARKGSVIPDEVADAGLESLGAPGAVTDALTVARWMAATLTRAHQG